MLAGTLTKKILKCLCIFLRFRTSEHFQASSDKTKCMERCGVHSSYMQGYVVEVGSLFGHWKVLPERSMSLMRVSMGVFPTSLTKNSCSITEAETVLKEGRRRRSLPNLVGWLGYWVLQYSSRAHCDFSCSCSITEESVKPIASENRKE